MKSDIYIPKKRPNLLLEAATQISNKSGQPILTEPHSMMESINATLESFIATVEPAKGELEEVILAFDQESCGSGSMFYDEFEDYLTGLVGASKWIVDMTLLLTTEAMKMGVEELSGSIAPSLHSAGMHRSLSPNSCFCVGRYDSTDTRIVTISGGVLSSISFLRSAKYAIEHSLSIIQSTLNKDMSHTNKVLTYGNQFRILLAKLLDTCNSLGIPYAEVLDIVVASKLAELEGGGWEAEPSIRVCLRACVSATYKKGSQQ